VRLYASTYPGDVVGPSSSTPIPKGWRRC
jgi:hypothetical protein